MDLTANPTGQNAEIIALVTQSFVDSDGAEEGAMVGRLIRDLLDITPPPDLHVFTAARDGALVGAICLSRLTFDQDTRIVFLLSPVAVRTDMQGQGIGQRLVRFGLGALRDTGVDCSVTYGSPDYYAKTGYQPMTVDFAQPPVPLGYPQGWLGQSLTGAEFAPLHGASTCVPALRDPAYW